MDVATILSLMIRAAHGDEEAEKELLEQSCISILNAIHAIQTLTDLRIEPGSFLLGMAYESNSGIDFFANPKNVEHVKGVAETVREL